jgi:RNA polymerase primary sigma factor
LGLPSDNLPVTTEDVGATLEPSGSEQSREIDFDEECEAPDRGRTKAQDAVLVNSVRTYLQQIEKVALLTAQQEVDLAKRIEVGLYAAKRLRRADETAEGISPQLRRDLLWIARDGERAKNRLVEANLRLVLSVAKRYTGGVWPFRT